jgi:hypothetical protein
VKSHVTFVDRRQLGSGATSTALAVERVLRWGSWWALIVVPAGLRLTLRRT